jgi:hypothetical protein
VAFIEDHGFPARDGAEKLIEAHVGPWAAVGYAFTNANPKSYLSTPPRRSGASGWTIVKSSRAPLTTSSSCPGFSAIE